MSDQPTPEPEIQSTLPVEPVEEADLPGAESRPRLRAPWWRLGVVALALAGLTWGAGAGDLHLDLGGAALGGATSPTPGAGEPVLVEAADLACPGAVPVPTGAAAPRTVVAAAAVPPSVLLGEPPRPGTIPPIDEPGEGDGSLSATATDAGTLALQPSRAVDLVLDGDAAGLVQARGQLAPGLVGGQLGVGDRPGARGLTSAACTPAAETIWLVGGGAAPGQSEQLVLTNPGPDAITVDVTVRGAEGPVETTGGAGIVVPGGARVVELLDGIAAGAPSPVVTVRATGGAVTAHLAETFREGTTDLGSEVVGPAAAPATDLVVPALPLPPEGHEHQIVLRLVAPDAQAVVDVTALTEQGAVPMPGAVTRVPGGQTVDVVLDALPEGATALRLRSDEPVTAGARLQVDPVDDEPLDPPEPPDTDAATATSGADDAAVTSGPDEDADESEDTTSEPEEEPTGDEPLRRPAGDLAWVAAAAVSTEVTGLALPDRGAVPEGAAQLALTAVDGTTAWVTWALADGSSRAATVDLGHDTTVLLDVPAEARAVWVDAAGPAGLASALHVSGMDERGPYVTATTLPQLPWWRQVTLIRPVVP